MVDKNQDRFYNNYDEIRDFSRGLGELVKKEEVLALSDLLFNTREIEENKIAREENEYINLLCEQKGIHWTIRRQAIQEAGEELQTLVQILILLHIDKDGQKDFDR